MGNVIRFITIVITSLITVGAAYAQWPLGRDTQPSLKLGEPAGAITVTGRYQIFVSPNIKGHTFMLDTNTGKVWIMKKDSMSGDFSFQRVLVEQIDSSQTGTAVQSKSKTGEKESSKQK
jgi:hypothetical protein